ncbi:hypothetical protein [Nonomuraea dietziae]|uniref:hypothetical protein n=1 Tax=Nonomuraea dietziae TaxID=65515 RepID=UPI00341EDDCB
MARVVDEDGTHTRLSKDGLPVLYALDEQAVEHIAGYTLMCDWSAREDLLRNLGLGHPMPESITDKGGSCERFPTRSGSGLSMIMRCRQEVRHSNCSCHLQDSYG